MISITTEHMIAASRMTERTLKEVRHAITEER